MELLWDRRIGREAFPETVCESHVMDDSRKAFRAAPLCAIGLLAMTLSGCSLFVMAGKMLFGDPTIPCAFHSATKVDLVKDHRRVLVVATTPEAIKSEWTSLNVDLIDGVTRRLKVQGIDVVNPDDVASWLDDNGGTFDHPTELAEHFNVDYIIHIDIERFTFHEENSPTLYRGRTRGNIVGYSVQKVNGAKVARHVFEREFNSEYPEQYPLAAESISDKVFQKKYMDRVCAQITFLFYDHKLSEEIE